MKIDADTRRANLWLFVGLMAFAILLCALVLVWMRARTHAQGGKVYPAVTFHQLCHPERSELASVAEGPSGRRQTLPRAYRRSEGLPAAVSQTRLSTPKTLRSG